MWPSPSRTAPAPMAALAASPLPPKTGVPSGRPQAAEALAVSVPAWSVDRISGEWAIEQSVARSSRQEKKHKRTHKIDQGDLPFDLKNQRSSKKPIASKKKLADLFDEEDDQEKPDNRHRPKKKRREVTSRAKDRYR